MGLGAQELGHPVLMAEVGQIEEMGHLPVPPSEDPYIGGSGAQVEGTAVTIQNGMSQPITYLLGHYCMQAQGRHPITSR
jgi:hypothetical protein